MLDMSSVPQIATITKKRAADERAAGTDAGRGSGTAPDGAGGGWEGLMFM